MTLFDSALFCPEPRRARHGNKRRRQNRGFWRNRLLALELLERRWLLSADGLNSTTWTSIGPSGSGVDGIAIDPQHPTTFYIAADNGGLWRTNDSGQTWNPLTDQPADSQGRLIRDSQGDLVTRATGAIAVAPLNSEIVYVATGNNDNGFLGDGLLISSDAGTHWTFSAGGRGDPFYGHQISKIVVAPNDPQIVYVALMVNSSTTASGVWKSTDGGQTWSNTTAAISTSDDYTDLAIDPANPQILMAAVGTWAGSKANGVYRSTDGGNTWSLVSGVPSGTAAGSIRLAVAPSQPATVYAAVVNPEAAGVSALLRSTDAGADWTAIDVAPNELGSGVGSQIAIAVAPADSTMLALAGVAFNSSVYLSTNGGSDWSDVDAKSQATWNTLGLAFDASGRLLDAGGAGILAFSVAVSPVIVTDLDNFDATSETAVALDPTNTQVAYAVGNPYYLQLYSGAGNWTNDPIQIYDLLLNPADPETIYSIADEFGTSGNTVGLFRSDDGGKSLNLLTSDSNLVDGSEVLALDPSNSNRLLIATKTGFGESIDGGDTISYTTVPADTQTYAIALADVAGNPKGIIYLLTNQGVLTSSDDGATWSQSDPKIIPYLGAANIIVDNSDSTGRTAYIAVRLRDASSSNIFRTTDGGATWSSIAGNLPNGSANAMLYDSKDNSLFVATDAGIWACGDPGESQPTWTALGTGLPDVPVEGLDYDPTHQILAAATDGRGVWELQLNDLRLGPVTVFGDQNNGFQGVVATFSDADDNTSPGVYQATIDWGDGQSSAGTVVFDPNRGFDIIGSHTYQEAPQSLNVTITVSDSDGASAAVSGVVDAQFTASGVTVSAFQGSPVSSALATFTDPNVPLSPSGYEAAIDWGDGTNSPGTVFLTPDGGNYYILGNHIYANANPAGDTVTVVISRPGLPSVTVTSVITVAAAPVLQIPVEGTVGTVLTATVANFAVYQGTVPVPASDFTATIDWGDGQTSSGTVTQSEGTDSVAGTHTYSSPMAADITVSVSEDAGPIDIFFAHVNVVAVGDTSLSGSGAVLSGSAFTAIAGTVATFSDSNPAAMAGQFSATIDWGDGGTSAGTVSQAGAGFSVAGSHTYQNTGTFTVATTITDSAGSIMTDGSAVIGASNPLGLADQVYVIGSGAVSVSAADGLLVNAPAPSQLSVTAGTVTGAQGGTFTLNADGSFSYTPAANSPGYDSAPFTVSDVSGDKATQAVTVLSQHAAVVWKFYESVLNRTPDAGGLQYWTNYFNGGGQTGQMAVGFFESDELLDKIITNYYQEFLLRTPDASGSAYWVGIWQATGGPEQIKAGFADSPEFYNSAGGTPQTWINALYQRILSRAPDPSGESFWLNYYQQQTAAGTDAGSVRYNIALGFFDSAESYGQDVASWFQEYLFRAPTADEQAQYVSQMEAGANDRTIEQAITNLPEYANSPAAPADGAGTALPDFYQAAPQSQAALAAKDAVFASL